MPPPPEAGGHAVYAAASHKTHHHFLLRTLLEQYERGKSFGVIGSWRRDCILRVDQKSLPDYFAADGRERLAGLKDAALRLQSEGAARVVFIETFGEKRIHELRLGPAELAAAYQAAAAYSFLPLAEALGQLGRHVRALQATASVPWMQSFLQDILAGIPNGELRAMGMQRERFKRSLGDVLDALTAAVALSPGVDEWERMLSERLFRYSKRLGSIRSLVAALLTRADPRWLDLEEEDILPAYGVRRKPGYIVCAGGASLQRVDRVYELADFAPVAHIPDAWSQSFIAGVAAAPIHTITTIENEFPFLAYVEEAGGPAGLLLRRELVIFLSGFPTPRLVDTLCEICHLRPDLQWRHWGDADVGGLRIWWLLRTRLGQPLHLFRTTADWLHAAAVEQGGIPLQEAEVQALKRLRQQLSAGETASDIEQACCLIDALLLLQVKVEQERY